MKEKVITDNAGEKITVKWDGERFALIQAKKGIYVPPNKTILLNPREALDLMRFIDKHRTLGGG